MVKQIQGKYKVNSPDLRPLWEEARRRIARLERFEISHALRHKNKEADQLANDAMDRGSKRQSSPAERSSGTSSKTASAARSTPRGNQTESPKLANATQMLRGFTQGGSIHLLGGAGLPDGIFVKIIPE
jgi:probable phosphoglycerate mutase